MATVDAMVGTEPGNDPEEIISGNLTITYTEQRTGYAGLRCFGQGQEGSYNSLANHSGSGGNTYWNATALYVTIWKKWKTLGNGESFLTIVNSSGIAVAEGRTDSNGKPCLYQIVNNDAEPAVLLARGAAALPNNTYHRIDIKVDKTAGAWQLRTFDEQANLLDSQSGSSNGIFGSANLRYVLLGNYFLRGGAPFDFYFDDVAVSRFGFIADGDTRIYDVPIAGEGAYQGFTGPWTNCDERPVSTADYVSTTELGESIRSFSLKALTECGVDPRDDILAIKIYGWFRSTSGATFSLLLRISDDYDDWTQFTTSTTAKSVSKILNSNPETNAAWTISDVNGCEVGPYADLTGGTAYCYMVRACVLVRKAIYVPLEPIDLSAQTQNVTVTPGPVSVQLQPVSSSLSIPALAVQPGAVSVLLEALEGSLAAQDASVVPGDVGIQLQALMSTLDVQGIAVLSEQAETLILLSPLQGQIALQSITVEPGPVAVQLQALAMSLAVLKIKRTGGLVTLPDGRRVLVSLEDRLVKVPQEDRIVKVPREDRIIPVPGEGA